MSDPLKHHSSGRQITISKYLKTAKENLGEMQTSLTRKTICDCFFVSSLLSDPNKYNSTGGREIFLNI